MNNQLWTEAEGLKVAHRKILTEIGSIYVALQATKKQVELLEQELKEHVNRGKAIEEAFKKTVEAIAQAHGITDGNLVLDFDKREVTNGQVSDSGND